MFRGQSATIRELWTVQTVILRLGYQAHCLRFTCNLSVTQNSITSITGIIKPVYVRLFSHNITLLDFMTIPT